MNRKILFIHFSSVLWSKSESCEGQDNMRLKFLKKLKPKVFDFKNFLKQKLSFNPSAQFNLHDSMNI